MKTTIHIKKTVGYINLIALASALLISCSNNPESNTSMGGDPKLDTASAGKDAKFLTQVAMINMEEIRLGELAQQNSSMKDVKEFGEMMEEDHKKSQDELTQLAAKKSITLPSSPDANAEADYKKLSSKSGPEFDNEYIDMMVTGHKDAIALFKSEAANATDADIRQWAGATLPTLQKHLDHATTCQEKCKNM